MSNRLQGQTAWITGGASGMGEATAELFAEEGANVCIVDIQNDLGKKLAAKINKKSGGRAIFTPCDVTKEKAVKTSIDRAAKEFGGLQIVVNCAGIVHAKKLHETSEKEWDLLMGVNVKSIFFSMKHGAPHLFKNKRSYMTNIGSVGSFIGQGRTPGYTTSKGAVLQLSRSIGLDYAADGLRCNCICPGITDTPMFRYHMSKAKDPEAAIAQRLKRVPMGIKLESRDIAKAALYFSCEDSVGITATSLIVDCGYIAAAEWETVGKTKFMQ